MIILQSKQSYVIASIVQSWKLTANFSLKTNASMEFTGYFNQHARNLYQVGNAFDIKNVWA